MEKCQYRHSTRSEDNMPIKIGDYEYDYMDQAQMLREPVLVSKPRPSYPFANSSAYVVEEDYMVLIDFYQPTRPIMGFRNPIKPEMVYVGDSPISPLDAGVGKFTRTWASIPGYGQRDYIRSDYEGYAYTVPGVGTDQSTFYQFPVESSTLINGKYIVTATVGAESMGETWDDLDIEVGKPALLGYYITDPRNGDTIYRTIVRKALAVTTNTITIDAFPEQGPVTFTYVQRANTTQASYVKQVLSRLDYSYFIVGYNCTSEEDIPIIEQDQIIDNATGGRTETLTGATTPSHDTWLDYVADGRWIVAEGSILRPWQGLIYERITRYVRATI